MGYIRPIVSYYVAGMPRNRTPQSMELGIRLTDFEDQSNHQLHCIPIVVFP